MTTYYSPSNSSFYFSALCGLKTLRVPDPTWLRPMIAISDIENPDGPPKSVPDVAAVHPFIDVPNPRIPDDAVEVSDADYSVLMIAQSAGKRIVANSDGYPVSQDQPPDVLAARARDRRDTLLSASDWTQLADAPVDQAAWAAYRQQLRDVPLQENFPETVAWPPAPAGDE